MPQRALSESGYYHVVTRTAGQIALFEDDADRRKYLRLLKMSRDTCNARIIAWVLMTDHVHLVIDFGSSPASVSEFMSLLDASYSKYFNAKTGRAGTLFQGRFWSKPIEDDSQLVATVHYLHMNPEMAGIAPMREYRWSSYREYAGVRWVVDTSTILGYFGTFELFDAYRGKPEDVVRPSTRSSLRRPDDEGTLTKALELAGVDTSSHLRSLPRRERNDLIRTLNRRGTSGKVLARTFGLGTSTISRILRE